MTDPRRLLLTRRQLLKAGGLTAIAAGAASFGPRLVGTIVQPGRAQAADKPPNLKLVGTDGWMSLPPTPSIFSSSLGRHHAPGPVRARRASRPTSSGSPTRAGWPTTSSST